MEIYTPNRLAVLVDKYYMALRRIIFRITMRVSGNARPGSYPYISGDSFREIADHIHDETSNADPEKISIGDVVFVSNDRMRPYLQKVHPRIKHPYVLIEHNGDLPVDKSITDLLDDKIVRFYAQDNTYRHEKVRPIPIGIENRHFYLNGIPSVFRKLSNQLKKHPPIRKNKILYRFNIQTNPDERKKAIEILKRHPHAETFAFTLSPTMHLNRIKTYKFVASPPGNSIESCRTWEALYLRTVPIVKDFVAMEYFAKIGLPMWIIDEWKELENLSETDLSEKYEEFIRSARWDALHMDFWIKMIREDQRIARNMPGA